MSIEAVTNIFYLTLFQDNKKNPTFPKTSFHCTYNVNAYPHHLNFNAEYLPLLHQCNYLIFSSNFYFSVQLFNSKCCWEKHFIKLSATINVLKSKYYISKHLFQPSKHLIFKMSSIIKYWTLSLTNNNLKVLSVVLKLCCPP